MLKRAGNVRSNFAHLRRQFLSPIIIEYTLNVHASRRSGKGQRSAALRADHRRSSRPPSKRKRQSCSRSSTLSRLLRRVRATHRRQSSRLPASIQFCHEISSQSQRNIPIPQPNPRYSLFNPSSGFDSSQGITSGGAGDICDVAQSRSHSAIDPLAWKALAACFSAGPKCHCEHQWKPGKIGDDATEPQRLSILVAARRREPPW